MRKEFFCFHGNLCQNQNGSTFLCQNNLTTSGLGLSLSPVKWPVSCILTTDFKVKIRNRNEEISYQMHVFANSRYLLALKNIFELPCDEIYLKIQAANLRAHILTDLNNENRNVNTKKFLTYASLPPNPHASGLQVHCSFIFQKLNRKSTAYIPCTSTPSCL